MFALLPLAVWMIVGANDSQARAAAPPTENNAKPAVADISDYRPVAGWPTLPVSLELGPVSAVATDSADGVYVLQRAEPPVLVFDQDGKFLRSWGEGQLKYPHGLRIDRDDHIWVTDTGRHVVMKFDTHGKRLMTLGREGMPGDGPDQFNKPTDVAVASSGEVYVADGYGNARVVKFSMEGKFLAQWGKPGSGEGEFNLPHAIRADANGRIYVGDRENKRVQVFDPDGKFIAEWPQSGSPYGLYLAFDRLFVADGDAQRITVLDLEGKRVGHLSTGAGDSNAPHWVCVDGTGAVYVAYVGGKRIQKLILEPAKAVIDKAIQALGGEANLGTGKVIAWKSKGKIHFGGNESNFTSQTTVAGLNRFRQEFESEFDGNPIKGVTVLDGDKGWRKFGDMSMELDQGGLANEKRSVYLQVVPATLLPLKGKDFRVEAAGEEKVGDADAVIIKISPPDGKEFMLSFDKTTGLPVKLVAKVTGFMGDEYTQETSYGNYKDFGGIKKATKIEAKRDGERLLEAEITDFELLEQVDPDTFAEPK